MRKQITLLYAEDHEMFRKRILNELAPFNIVSLSEAGNGKELLDRLYMRPDIILLDLEMPEMNGSDALEFIMEYIPESRVIVVSFHDDPLLGENYKERGAKGYISKDAITGNFKLLVQAIRKVNAGGTYFHTLPQANVKYTSRQKELLPPICDGLTNKEIAMEAGIQERAVEKQKKKNLRKGSRGRCGKLLPVCIYERVTFVEEDQTESYLAIIIL